MSIDRLSGWKFLLFSLILVVFQTNSVAAGEILVIGHRGAAGLLPENTIVGFKKAIELGVDIIELDVHLTFDHEAVVCHDSKLNPAITRNANGGWIKDDLLIKNLTLLEIQTYDVGKLKHSEKYAKKYPDQKSVDGEHIPTLRDVIKVIKRSNDKTHIFIELKFSPLDPGKTKPPEEIANVVAKIIKEENIAGRVCVISFDWKILMYFQSIVPEVPTGYVTIAKNDFDTLQRNKAGASPWTSGIDIDDYDSIPKAVKAAGGTYWITNVNHATGHKEKLNSKIIEKAHSEGIKVIAWTPDSESDMKKLVKMGVDGITTNRPDILLSILKD